MPSFEATCFDAVKRFVQTAVVIDDQAGYPKTVQSSPKPVMTPPTGLTSSFDSEPVASVESCIVDESDLKHVFDINMVVNGFADLKITCSVQRPDFDSGQELKEKLKEWALNCAEHADITIIDWRLSKTDSHLAEDIIVDLLKKDKKYGGKVRLLCVYTMQPNPRNILKDIKERIKKELNLSISKGQEGLACTVDGKIRIVAFSKNETKTFSKLSDIVTFRELPERALKEFAILVKGLIPRATLHSIAAVREQTYSLLALMNKHLDGAFCAHRALIPDTEDSIDFILNMISKEISTKILYDKFARNSLDTESIRNWYDGQELPESQYALNRETLWELIEKGGGNLTEVRKLRAKAWLERTRKNKNKLKNVEGEVIKYSDAEELCEKGVFNEIKNCAPPSKNNPDSFAELFYQDEADAKNACNELSRLNCSSKDECDLGENTKEGLYLTLGSVLKVMEEKAYYILCLQPPCDSVRLKDETVFLFLHLYEGKKGNTDFVIKLHDGTYQALSIKAPLKKPKFKTFPFIPDKNTGRVLINKLKENQKWVAELRLEKAQEMAQKVFNNASRIGLDEFEILRLKGSRI